jgi:hypothetical protein
MGVAKAAGDIIALAAALDAYPDRLDKALDGFQQRRLAFGKRVVERGRYLGELMRAGTSSLLDSTAEQVITLTAVAQLFETIVECFGVSSAGANQLVSCDLRGRNYFNSAVSFCCSFATFGSMTNWQNGAAGFFLRADERRDSANPEFGTAFSAPWCRAFFLLLAEYIQP